MSDNVIFDRKYSRTNLSNTFTLDSIVTVHYFEYTKDYIGDREAHDFWEMVYVDIGSIQVMADESYYTLNKGDVIFHKPWEPHQIINSGCFASTFILSFQCSSKGMKFFENRILKSKNREKEIISKIINESRYTFIDPLNIMNQLRLNKNNRIKYGAEQLIQNYIVELLILLIRDNIREIDNKEILYQNSTKSSYSKNNFMNALNYIRENLYHHLSLKIIAENLGYSISSLERIFKIYTHHGVMQYINILKLDDAKKMLSEDKLSISDISHKLNFSSIHYFSRLFKKYVGTSPSSYRRTVMARSLL